MNSSSTLWGGDDRLDTTADTKEEAALCHKKEGSSCQSGTMNEFFKGCRVGDMEYLC
jgi:hypothetical protein